MITCGPTRLSFREEIAMVEHDVRKAIDVVNRHFEDCVNRGDIAAACSVYTEDARLLPPDAPMVTGRAAIVEFWKAAVPALGVKSVKLGTVELAVSGDMAREIGEATLALASGAATIKFVVVWRRQADGQWKWATDIWNNGGVK
jgi:ketosteroid isomerase-like protein